MSDLTTAIMLAAEMHDDQTDKAGKPYILHPLSVMMAMDTDDERIVAVLHDVAEDSEDGWARIHDAGFAPHIIEAIDAVTRRKDEGESYEDFITRAGRNPLGSRVKMADLQHNLDRARRDHISDELAKRYRRALNRLIHMEVA